MRPPRNDKRRSASSGRNGRHKAFWNKEYKTSEHLALSDNPAEDLMKFCRWQEREYGGQVLNRTLSVLDLGCGNGRNLVFLAGEYGCRGTGFDISEEAVRLAVRVAAEKGLSERLAFETRSIAEPLPLPDVSVGLVLDMMTSHFLRAAEREALRAEILRVLKPGGWLFFKSFFAEGDLHVRRLLAEHPADEPGAYIHPELGVYEYAWTEEALRAFFEPFFIIHKMDPSHLHLLRGKAFKRRTISVYLQKLG